jgi:hypothetical protein
MKMKIKSNTQYYFIIGMILLLICCIPYVNAIVIGNWTIDVKTYYSATETVEESIVFHNGSISPASESYIDYDLYTYEITEINANLKTVSVIKTHHGVGSIITDFSYDPIVLANNLVNNLFIFEYQIDDSTKELMFTDFKFDYKWITYLIEPTWDLLNTNFKEIVNTSRLISQINNGTQLIQLTFGDFINSLEHYSVMEKEDITVVKNIFPNDTIQWTFVFTLDNTMNYYHYIADGDFWEKFVFEDYHTYLGFDYSLGGRLQGLRYLKTYTLNTNNMTKFLYNHIEIKKTFAPLATPVSYEFLSIILVLMILSPIITRSRKKI